MRNKYKFIILLVMIGIVSSCSKGDVFTGSPVGTNVDFVTLTGTISTTETNVVASQQYPITITLPQSFPVDVSVEVTSFLTSTNKKTKKSFIIPAGQTTITDKVNAPNTEIDNTIHLPFNLNLQVYLSAITTVNDALPKGFDGKQYSLTSNIINLDYGDTGLFAANSNKCSIIFDFDGYTVNGSPIYNELNIKFKKNGVITTIPGINSTSSPIYGTTTNNGRYEKIIFNSSAVDDTYTIEVFPTHLISSPSDVPYRFTIRYPDGTSKVFFGILNGLTIPAGTPVAKLQIIKSTDVNGANYNVTPLP